MNKKYELTDEIINYNNRKLYKIKALKDFSDVKKGDLGGYVENENNLSQDGYCWIYNNAKVYDDAKVYDNARVYDNAVIFDDAKVYDYAKVFGNAKIYGHAVISGYA